MPTIGGGDDFVWIGGPDEGLWLLIVVGAKRLMAAWRSATPLNTPRLSRRLVRMAKKPSTALSQLAEGDVKWKLQRG